MRRGHHKFERCNVPLWGFLTVSPGLSVHEAAGFAESGRSLLAEWSPSAENVANPAFDRPDVSGVHFRGPWAVGSQCAIRSRCCPTKSRAWSFSIGLGPACGCADLFDTLTPEEETV